MKNTGKIWSKEEEEYLRLYYSKYGSKYCESQLLRGHKAIIAKANDLGLKSERKTYKYSEENLKLIVQSSKSTMEVMRKIGLNAKGGNHKTIKKYIQQYNIDTSHFETQSARAKRTFENHISKIPLENILIENSNYSRTELKKRLYDTGLKIKQCEKCGQGEVWNGEKMSLILDHVNGVNNDNRIENLRILCPNCAATLDTHCRGVKRKKITNCVECNKAITNTSNRCLKCSNKQNGLTTKNRKVKVRPNFIVLKKEVNSIGYSATGRKYGVSDNAIRKWIKTYEKHNC